MFCKKAVLKNFANFIEKHLCQSLFFNNVASLTPAILLNKGLRGRCFPVSFAKYLWTPFLWNTSGGYFCKCVSKCHSIFLSNAYFPINNFGVTAICLPSTIVSSIIYHIIYIYIYIYICIYIYIYFFFISGFSFTDTDKSQETRGKEGNHLIPLYHFHPLTNI